MSDAEAERDERSDLPLDGLTVVSVEHAVAAPLATRHLADLGARVIKIERPGGGDFARQYDTTVRGLSSHFVWLNRSKESVALDLKQTWGRDVLRRLLQSADVFVHNLAPGAMDRLGFSADEARATNSTLIVCSISGYGTGGPYDGKRAYDLLIQCETGAVATTGTPEEPAKIGIPVADIAAGMYAYSGVLAALYRRARTGVGVAFEVAMLDALGEWMAYPAYFSAYSGQDLSRTGLHHPGVAPYGPFVAGDGQTVFVAVQNDTEWKRLCAQVLDRQDLGEDERFASNPNRVANRTALEEHLTDAFSYLSAVDLEARLDAASIANARLRSPLQFVEHPQHRARKRWQTIDSPVGPLETLLPPVQIGGAPVMGPVPALGEHTRPIMLELGYAEDEIARLSA